ncbi:MAG: hypothetical protein J6A21_00530 [Lentisphaeria bacterium]|nr:hypothetical protein [Lentisphaeria bacterium]
MGDTKEKHAKVLGKYIYAATCSMTNHAGEKASYIARIVLDGFGNENGGAFKDISVKKQRMARTYVLIS